MLGTQPVRFAHLHERLGDPEDAFRVIYDAVDKSIVSLLNDLKQPGDLSQKFQNLEAGSPMWRVFAWEIGDFRARETLAEIQRMRETLIAKAKAGQAVAQGPIVPLPEAPSALDDDR